MSANQFDFSQIADEVASHQADANVAAIRADLRARYMDGFVPNYLTLKDYQ